MNQKAAIIGTVFVVVLILSSCSDRSDSPAPGDLYLGQNPAGDTACVFAKGIVSTIHHEHSRVTFSKDATELFWAVIPIDTNYQETGSSIIARITTHIPDKGQVMVRYYGLYSNAHRGMMRKRGRAASAMPVLAPTPPEKASPGWRELIRKVYEVDPLTCPTCGAQMKVIDKIIHHLGITFTSERPPPPAARQQELY